MNVVIVVPTGIGCEIGGHCGDGNAPARLLGACCETLVLHPNVVMADVFRPIWTAQMAVGDPKQLPEYAGTVASVDTRDFWREVEESPRSQDYHYNRNAETYLLVGESMGRAMVRLQSGQADAIPKSDREVQVAAEVAAAAAKPVPAAEPKAASLAALKPMILDGALAAFVNNPRCQPELKAAIKGDRPTGMSPLLNNTLDEAADCFCVNGKLLAESKAGIVAWRREGWRPRGSHVWAGIRDEFKGGKVTIVVSNFLMKNRPADGFLPASRDSLSVWLEEMKIPPLEYKHENTPRTCESRRLNIPSSRRCVAGGRAGLRCHSTRRRTQTNLRPPPSWTNRTWTVLVVKPKPKTLSACASNRDDETPSRITA